MTNATDWHEWPCLGFDLETTGTNPLEAHPVQVSLVRFHPTQPEQVYTWLVRPDGWEIPDEAAAIHGITTAHATEHGEKIEDVLKDVVVKLATWLTARYPVAAMNAAYDFTVLEAEWIRRGMFSPSLAERLGGRRFVAPVVDPFVLDRHADKYRKGSRKLTDLANLYGVPLGGDAHDATADARAACILWPKIIAAHPGKFQGMTLKALHLAQIQWRREQCDGLRSYFDRNGTEHDGVDPGWPYLTTLPTEARP